MFLRSALLASGSLAFVATAACLNPPRDHAFEDAHLVDLTHTFDQQTVYWPTAPGFRIHTDFEGATEGGWFYESNTISTSEHGGTHLDAPVHFAEGGDSTEQIPLDRLVGPAAVIDVTDACRKNPDHAIGVDELEAWESRYGRLRAGEIVLLRTGFDRHWPDAGRYLGTDELGAAGVARLHFPGLSADAARFLARERRVAAVGIDTASLDPGQSKDFAAHRILFRENIPGFENLTRLEALPPRGATVAALPMKIGSGSGGPLRAIAILW